MFLPRHWRGTANDSTLSPVDVAPRTAFIMMIMYPTIRACGLIGKVRRTESCKCLSRRQARGLRALFHHRHLLLERMALGRAARPQRSTALRRASHGAVFFTGAFKWRRRRQRRTVPSSPSLVAGLGVGPLCSARAWRCVERPVGGRAGSHRHRSRQPLPASLSVGRRHVPNCPMLSPVVRPGGATE